MRRRGKPDPERLILNLRLKDLNRLIAHRHGGDAATYTLPDDDAGREYLYILISHYANVDPNAPRRIVRLRAPWMSADEAERVIDMAFSYQRRWRSSTLGRELNYSEAEWRMLRLRTVGPTGMTPEERKRVSAAFRMERHRRRKGKQTRAQYAKIGRTKPWEKEGISRRTWERRRAQNSGKTRDAGSLRISLTKRNGLASSPGRVKSEGVRRPAGGEPIEERQKTDVLNSA